MKSRRRWALRPDARAATGPGRRQDGVPAPGDPTTKRQEKRHKSTRSAAVKRDRGHPASRLTAGSAEAVPARDGSHLEQPLRQWLSEQGPVDPPPETVCTPPACPDRTQLLLPLGQVALTCRGPRFPLGRSTCVPLPGVAAVAPGSCPAAPWLLLPGSEEAAAPSGKLAASSRRPSSLPVLCPGRLRGRGRLPLWPAGGAGELGRLHHLRTALKLWARGGEPSLSKGYLPCAARGRMLESREPLLDDQARVTNRLNLASGCTLLSCLFLP